MTSHSQNFQGDMAGRELKEMNFGEFLSTADSADAQRQHYLAQVPVWSRESPESAPLKALLPDIKLPGFLDPALSKRLQAINFWMASR